MWRYIIISRRDQKTGAEERERERETVQRDEGREWRIERYGAEVEKRSEGVREGGVRGFCHSGRTDRGQDRSVSLRRSSRLLAGS